MTDFNDWNSIWSWPLLFGQPGSVALEQHGPWTSTKSRIVITDESWLEDLVKMARSVNYLRLLFTAKLMHRIISDWFWPCDPATLVIFHFLRTVKNSLWWNFWNFGRHWPGPNGYFFSESENLQIYTSDRATEIHDIICFETKGVSS